MRKNIKKSNECSLCEKKASKKLDDKNLCNKCFLNVFERKIKRQIRQKNKLCKGETILAIDNITEYVLKEVIKLPLNIITKNQSYFKITNFTSINTISQNEKLAQFIKENKINKVILPWTADNEIEFFLNSFMKQQSLQKNNQKQKTQKIQKIQKNLPKKFIKLFTPIPQDALEYYCELKKIKYTKCEKKNQKNNELKKLINDFELKYPGTKNALIKSSKLISSIR
ncbi:hypothetical protein HOK51_06640 [Candidatus Woesearchaeota archaeon]|jgi:tRNA(Ile)-lysidine synthase TilS/MesJ|nr:hypothetical protein [Candidatus Woesearchaeota archaeon]MBT7368724.1 hypothetical protein [Candidatus Woesearchaeota archaeon]